MHHFTRLLVPLLVTAASALAQGTKTDYERALSLAQRTDNKVFRTKVEPNWQPDGDTFWYRVQTGPDAHEFVFVDASKGLRSPAFDHAKLAAALSEATGKQLDASRLSIERLHVNADEDWVRFRFDRKRWHYARDTGVLRELPDDIDPDPVPADLKPRPSRTIDGALDTHVIFVNRTREDVRCFWLDEQTERHPYATLKPGESHRQHTYEGHVWLVESLGGVPLGIFEGKRGDSEAVIESRAPGPATKPPAKPAPAQKSPWSAFIRDFNVWIRNGATGEELQLSRDGKAGDRYRDPLLISPDGKRLVAIQEQPAQEHTVYFVESSPKDQVQPKLHKHQYLKPGDRIARPQVRLFDLEKREPLPITIGAELSAKPWSITDLRWHPSAPMFYFLYNERGHQVLRMMQVDAAAGHAAPLVEEKSATFVDYSQKTWFRWLDKTGELLWASERDGWNHIYLHDAASGELKSRVTSGAWNVRSVIRVDEEKRHLLLRVMGVHAGQDPYHMHLARVNFDGSGFTMLTDGDGTRGGRRGTDAPELSPNGRWLLDTYSRVDLPPVTELRDAQNGKLVCVLEKADASAQVAAGWTLPERFAAKGRDRGTDIFGIIIKPSNFDPLKKYPVVEEIYAGPHDYFVPKEWGRQVRQHAIAELGFIVVQIDGMGTNWRGKAFHDVAWRNLKDAGFPDRIAWMKAAAATRPWMDLTRVGIFGGSAGGQNALAGLLHHGDFYKVGVADCGCHDNRMDKIWWNEAWLGETGPWYAENSNVTHAAKLAGRLLLIVGELDTNVDPASTMQVVNALEKADKDFDLCIVTGSNHGAAESPYGSRRRMDFLVRHLLGTEPRIR